MYYYDYWYTNRCKNWPRCVTSTMASMSLLVEGLGHPFVYDVWDNVCDAVALYQAYISLPLSMKHFWFIHSFSFHLNLVPQGSCCCSTPILPTEVKGTKEKIILILFWISQSNSGGKWWFNLVNCFDLFTDPS